MPDIYTQLFNSYTHDIEYRLKAAEKEVFEMLTKEIPMSDGQQVDLADSLSALRSRCCAESFTLGIQLGMRLTWEYGFSLTTAS